MDDDHEVLDWGNEDDEQLHFTTADRQPQARGVDADHKRSGDTDDVEDAVSLGGDEDDIQDYMTYQTHSDQAGSEKAPSVSKVWPASRSDVFKPGAEREQTPSPGKELTPQPQSSPPANSSHSSRIHPPPQNLTHALPPKPRVSNAPFPTLPSTTAASPMSMARRDKERRANGTDAKLGDALEALPPDWEVRHSRSGGRDVYFYNTKTTESTWTRPVLVDGRSPSHYGRNRVRADGGDSWVAGRDDDVTIIDLPAPSRARSSEVVRDEAQLSYDDRHYRPNDPIVSSGANQDDGREDRTHARISSRLQPSTRSSIGLDDREQARQSQVDYQRAAVEGSTRGRRSSSVPPRDNNARRAPEKDIFRSDVAGYCGSDHRLDIHEPYSREASRAPIYDRSRQEESYAASRETSTAQGFYSASQGTLWSSSAPPSTLSTSSPPSPSTSRTLRLCSSRGGGLVFVDRLEKPWESSGARPTCPFIGLVLNRLMGAHDGPLPFVHPFP
ncbi:hypothetical protein EW146_g2212 [Bondarzewia mesenterica]|uniref:WW domain-containing protein n=1 Tax=Bondarzewia mesenterica TaxID=1095465 RepID=A0A4S4M3A7_9AGAM|nr:hypothetical protein EW146_g2212 [Bondarzewia mesenterica]